MNSLPDLIVVMGSQFTKARFRILLTTSLKKSLSLPQTFTEIPMRCAFCSSLSAVFCFNSSYTSLKSKNLRSHNLPHTLAMHTRAIRNATWGSIPPISNPDCAGPQGMVCSQGSEMNGS